MSKFATIAAILSAVGAQTTVGFGPYFSLGPTASWIREANTTLVLPKVPSPQQGNLALWPGMGTSGGDLIQALAVASDDSSQDCGGTGKWCVWASTLKDDYQWGGKQVVAVEGDNITMSYVYQESTGNYSQNVFINDELVSSLSTNDGQAQGWGTAVECQAAACTATTAYAHKYISTTIKLNAADTTFAGTLATNEVTSTGLTTEDNITFKVDTINVQDHTYNVSS